MNAPHFTLPVLNISVCAALSEACLMASDNKVTDITKDSEGVKDAADTKDSKSTEKRSHRETCWPNDPVYAALLEHPTTAPPQKEQLAQLGARLRTLVRLYNGNNHWCWDVRVCAEDFYEFFYREEASKISLGGSLSTYCAVAWEGDTLVVDVEYYANQIRGAAKGSTTGNPPSAGVKAAPEEYVKAFLSAFESK
jgi:hypothetical protein